MCGLIGVMGNLYQRDLKFFSNMLVADYARGKHSTGLTAVNHTGVNVVKKVLNPCDFLDLKQVDSLLTVSAKCLMGHNRAATKGAVNAANAHPFQHGDITLMHNGTLTNKYNLQTQFKAPVFDTDSELVCWLIDNYDLQEVIRSLEGAFALIWWDASDDTMHVIRNDERPLSLCVYEDTVYWASEKHMLRWGMERCNVWNDKTVTMFTPKVGKHFTFSYTNRKVSTSAETLELAPPKKASTTYQSGYNAGYTGRSQGQRHNAGATNPNPTKGHPSVQPIHSAKDKLLREFNDKYALNLEEGSLLYCYLNKASRGSYAKGSDRCDLELTLAVEPWCDVSVKYVMQSPQHVPEDLFGVILQVKNIRKEAGKWILVGDNDPAAIELIHPTNRKLKKEMNDWIDERTPPLLSEGEAAPSEQAALPSPETDTQPPFNDFAGEFIGFEGRILDWNRWRQTIDRGCAICDQTLDPVAEALDRTCIFISHDDVICSECNSDERVIAEYGLRTQ